MPVQLSQRAYAPLMRGMARIRRRPSALRGSRSTSSWSPRIDELCRFSAASFAVIAGPFADRPDETEIWGASRSEQTFDYLAGERLERCYQTLRERPKYQASAATRSPEEMANRLLARPLFAQHLLADNSSKLAFCPIDSYSERRNGHQYFLADNEVTVVDGYILDGDRLVGALRRYLHRANRPGAPLECYLGGLYLAPSYQGHGHGRHYLQQTISTLKQCGVERVWASFDGTTGAFAYARYGLFDFSEPSESAFPRRDWQRTFGRLDDKRSAALAVWTHYGGRERAQLAWMDGHIPKELYDLSERYFERLASGKAPAPTPLQMSNIGTKMRWHNEQGREMWLGKAIMLGAEWVGELRLTA